MTIQTIQTFFSLLLFIVSGAFLWFSIQKTRIQKQIDKTIQQDNAELEKQRDRLTVEVADLTERRDCVVRDYEKAEQEYKKRVSENSKLLKDHTEIFDMGLENYNKVLEQAYRDIEVKFDEKVGAAEQAHSEKIQLLNKDITELVSKIAELACIEKSLVAEKKERAEIELGNLFNQLQVSESDLNDIKVFESIRPHLKNQRALSMLIWSTFFQKPTKELIARILQSPSAPKTSGIYKITNLKDGKVYIGQSVDIATRLTNHIKCGLGIDTPATKLLYKAMLAEGVWNFSYHVVEQCEPSKLDLREKFYIAHYKALEFGYNATKGNG